MALQGQLTERTYYLTLANVPVTGIAYSAVTVKLKKFGQTAFVVKTLTALDWVELGNGYYTLKLSPSDMDTVGSTAVIVSGLAFDPVTLDQFMVDPVPTPVLAAGPDICVLTGTIKNISGGEPLHTRVTARPVEFPAKYNMNVIAADIVWTVLDSYGMFSLPLVQGSTVIIEIERAAIKHQIVIPYAPSANLIDLLPPFVVDYS